MVMTVQPLFATVNLRFGPNTTAHGVTTFSESDWYQMMSPYAAVIYGRLRIDPTFTKIQICCTIFISRSNIPFILISKSILKIFVTAVIQINIFYVNFTTQRLEKLNIKEI